MKTVVMAAYDKKARAFLNPFYSTHIDVGVRAFAQAANTTEHQVYLHPEDFALYQLGTFNDENGAFELLGTPVHIAEALSLKKGIQHV